MKALLIFAGWATFGSIALASEPVDWPNLKDPSAQTFDDPYRDLSFDDIEAIKAIVCIQKALTNEGLTEEKQAAFKAEGDDAELQLMESGLDAEWLIDQRWAVAERRELAATAGNPAVDGKAVVLSSYAIPAPPDTDGTPVSYLVPERGMSSHMPPPNANQMIRVRLTDAWQPRLMHEPVRLTGKLIIAPTQKIFRVVDGPVQMNATFEMEVQHVETWKNANGRMSQAITSDGASTFAQDKHAPGSLPALAQEVIE